MLQVISAVVQHIPTLGLARVPPLAQLLPLVAVAVAVGFYWAS